jgi:hypothetical protein
VFNVRETAERREERAAKKEKGVLEDRSAGAQSRCRSRHCRCRVAIGVICVDADNGGNDDEMDGDIDGREKRRASVERNRPLADKSLGCSVRYPSMIHIEGGKPRVVVALAA